MKSNLTLAGRAMLVALAVVFGTGLPACTSGEASDQQVAQDLESRVREVWECRIRKDYGRKYDLMSPDIRDVVEKNEFVNSKGFVNYYSYQIDRLEIANDTADVTVTYEWKANHFLFEKSPVKTATTTDPWVLVDGEWYMKYRTPSITGTPDGQVERKPDDDID